MANFIISPYAISFESIKNNLMNYVNNKDDAWQDFYASGAGQTVIELIAALGTFYAYHFIMGRRESYLSVAQNYTSLIGLAQNNGYSTNRGTNLQLYIKIKPNQSIILPKWTEFGSYGEYSLIITEDIVLNKNIEVNVPVVIGNLLEETISITTDQPMQFSFLNPNTTETFRLLLNDMEVPTSTQIKDLINDKYITISNTYGSYDVFYLNAGEYKYMNGDTLKSQFIERNTINSTNFNLGSISVDYANTVEGYEVIEDVQAPEGKEQIRMNAPLYHETSMVIRSRKDYSKYLKQANPYLLDANDKDIYPGLIELTYIKRDGLAMTENEKNFWLEKIEESRPSGVARAIITDPVEVNKVLNISVWKATGEYFSDTLSSDIDNILSVYDLKFASEIDLNQIEHDIEQLQGVKIARVELNEEEWQANHSYNYFDIVTTDFGKYYVSAFNYLSGNTEPTWPEEVGDTITDNDLIWEKVDEVASLDMKDWKPNSIYNMFDYIKKDTTTNGEYGASSTVQPIWGDNSVTDNFVVWTKLSSTPSTFTTWAAERIYYVDDVIKVRARVDDETFEDCYYKCTQCFKKLKTDIYRVCNYRFKSGSETPLWDTTIVTDNNLIWRKLPANTYTWTANTEYVLGDIIKTNRGKYYKLTAFTNRKYEYSGKSGNTEPKWYINGDLNIVYDNVLIWSKLSYNYMDNWESNTFYSLGQVVSVNDSDAYILTSFVGSSGNTIPDWENPEDGRVTDGLITWSLLPTDSRNIDLDWNQYIRLSKDNTTFKMIG